ncbi:hypothetical protein HWV62_33073 [Athelia sp. TMB]|nr:hypothetical protein HWV62_33073 [Athelia sp. TMB]
MYSEDSELTEISSSEDEVPLASNLPARKTKTKASPPEYQVKNSLKPPRTTQYTARSLYDQIIENTIDLDPEYQRDVVWPENKMSGIIDSILRNYYVPPVIFNVSYSDDGSELRTCIDGKQRLTSIMSDTGHKLWYKTAPGTKRKILPPQLKTKFANKQIVCVEYEGLSDDQERELFQRVQLGVALTPAERMQAIVGPWPTLIREFKDPLFSDEGFGTDLNLGTARGRDFQCLAIIFYYLNKPKAAHPGPQQLESWLADDAAVPARFKAEIDDTFKVFIHLVKHFNSVFHQPAKLAPVEFVCIATLIHHYRDQLSMEQLIKAIKGLRKVVREKHKDQVRLNSTVKKTVQKHVDNLNVAQLQKEVGKGKPATKELADLHMKGTLGVKRKRKTVVDSDSEDSEPSSPPPTKTKLTKRSPKASSSKSTSISARTNQRFSPGPPKRAPAKAPAPTTTKPSSSNTPRVSKVSPPNDTPAHKPSLPPSVPRQPSAPPITVKSEPEPPMPIDRLAPIRAAKMSSSQSPVVPTFSLAGQTTVPPQDSRRSLPQRPSWSSIPPSSTVYPPGQTNMDAMLAQNGISPSAQQPSNMPFSNSRPAEPTFRQDLRNPLHGKPAGTDHRPPPPNAPRGIPNGHSHSHYPTGSSYQPPPTSASSSTSTHFPPPTSAASMSSNSSWPPRSPPNNALPSRPSEHAPYRRDSGGYGRPPRPLSPRDSRYDRYADRDRVPSSFPQSNRGWGGRGRGYAPR